MNKLYAVEPPAWHVAYIYYSVQIQNVSLPCYSLFHRVAICTTSVNASLYGVYGYSIRFN